MVYKGQFHASSLVYRNWQGDAAAVGVVEVGAGAAHLPRIGRLGKGHQPLVGLVPLLLRRAVVERLHRAAHFIDLRHPRVGTLVLVFKKKV